MSETSEVIFDAWYRAIVCYLALRQKQEFVKKLESSGGRLMNRSDDKKLCPVSPKLLACSLSTYFVLLGKLLDKAHHFPTGR